MKMNEHHIKSPLKLMLISAYLGRNMSVIRNLIWNWGFSRRWLLCTGINLPICKFLFAVHSFLFPGDPFPKEEREKLNQNNWSHQLEKNARFPIDGCCFQRKLHSCATYLKEKICFRKPSYNSSWVSGFQTDSAAISSNFYSPALIFF